MNSLVGVVDEMRTWLRLRCIDGLDDLRIPFDGLDDLRIPFDGLDDLGIPFDGLDDRKLPLDFWKQI